MMRIYHDLSGQPGGRCDFYLELLDLNNEDVIEFVGYQRFVLWFQNAFIGPKSPLTNICF